MKYVELIDPEYLISSENELYKKYNIIRRVTDTSYYMHFYPWQMRSCSYGGIDTNWKARLSIHPEDINKAWEIILPFLYQRDIPFKVINLHAIEKFKKDRQEKLEKLIEEYDQFLQHSNSQNIDFLRTNFYRTYQDLSAYGYSGWRLISFVQTYLTKLTGFFIQYHLNKENLFARTKNIYERLIDLRKQKVKNSLRLYEGMQFTIYILSGFEKECQNTLEEIEDHLVKANIRPGIVFSTDRQIGLYSSIRHPGKWIYHNATDTNTPTYNPDNIDDPFRFLKSIPKKEIVQENEIQTMLEHSGYPK